MKKISFAGVIVLCIALGSCWTPVYNEKISSGALFYDRIGKPYTTIGPISLNNGYQFDQSEFLPTRAIDAVSGFWVARDSDGMSVSYVDGTVNTMSGSWNFATPMGDFALARAITVGSMQYILTPWGSSAATTSLEIEQYSASSFTSASNLGLGGGVAKIIAVGGTYNPGASDDMIAAIYVNSSSNLATTYYELNTLAGTQGSINALNSGSVGVPSYGNAFVALNAGSVTDLYYCGSTTDVLHWSWSNLSSPPSHIRVQDRLTGVLSDGTLVCQGPDFLSAYNPDGSAIFTVPAGSVRFIHEVSDGATTYCVFSQALRVTQNSGQDQLYIALWQVPIASFKSLGK